MNQRHKHISTTALSKNPSVSVMVSWMHNNASDINDIGREYNHREHRGTQRIDLKTLCSLLSSVVKFGGFYRLYRIKPGSGVAPENRGHVIPDNRGCVDYSAAPADNSISPACCCMLCQKLGAVVPLAPLQPLVWELRQKLARREGNSDEDESAVDSVLDPDDRVFSCLCGSVLHRQGCADYSSGLCQCAHPLLSDTGTGFGCIAGAAAGSHAFQGQGSGYGMMIRGVYSSQTILTAGPSRKEI